MPFSLSQHTQPYISSFKARNTHNLRTFIRSPLSEISGSLGDLGTFIPIFIALLSKPQPHTSTGIISAPSTLLFSGLANILTGLCFGVPLPVQPMKAIAAVAIASGPEFDSQGLEAAGLFVAAVIGILSVTGLLGWMTRVVPLPVVRGIQVGSGLSLAGSAFGYLQLGHWLGVHERDSRVWVDAAGIVLAVLLCGFASAAKKPFSVFLIGALIGLPVVLGVKGDFPGLSIWRPEVIVPNGRAVSEGIWKAGLGQVPLTALNSVIAVVILSKDLLPDAEPISATGVGLSVTLMNFVACWFRAMPMCHGSGGLAAQYRFGARSGASVIFLGLVKVLIGLFAGKAAAKSFDLFPAPLLAAMLFLAGMTLVSMGAKTMTESLSETQEEESDSEDEISRSNSRSRSDDEEGMQRWYVMMTTVATILATKNDGAGFLAGMAVHFGIQVQERLTSQSRYSRVSQRDL